MSTLQLKSRSYLWLRISIINLLIVSLLGVTLRYKIAFSLKFVDQKYLLHGHSHFAFAGWVTQALMALLVLHLSKRFANDMFKRYYWVLFLNLLSAYGMLISFPIQGYAFFSILFSVISIIASYIFSFMYWRDLKKSEPHPSKMWFRAALIFNVISSAGAFSLAGMMATHSVNQHLYLSSVYYFLHFQYNGWFFFAIFGLFCGTFVRMGIPPATMKKIFLIFVSACVPAYFLSVLWLPLPLILYIIIVVAAIAQVIAWFWLVKLIIPRLSYFKIEFVALARWLFGLSAIALTIKLLLQAGSVIPALSKLSYSFRPIIIGYLHLILLGIITIFLLGYFVHKRLFHMSKLLFAGIILFTLGIILNELLLMIQGIEGMNYTGIPYINIYLFAAALIIFFGLLFINITIKRPSESNSLAE